MTSLPGLDGQLRGCLSVGAAARASRRGSSGTLAAKTVGACVARMAADKRVARSLNIGALIALLSGVVSSGDGGHVGCGRPQRKVSHMITGAAADMFLTVKNADSAINLDSGDIPPESC